MTSSPPPAATDPLLAWLKPIEERAAKATPGPWEQDRLAYARRVCGDAVREGRIRVTTTVADISGNASSQRITEANAEFVVAARSDVPAMAAKLREMAGVLRDARQTLIGAIEVGVDLPDFDPTEHVTIKKIDAALAPPAPAKGSVKS